MRSRGFTLVEMVMTIVIGGIIVLGITGFIQLGFTGYSDSIARQKVQNQARFIVEKMAREVRHAVPNSFSLTNSDQCISFYPIIYSGFYTQDEINREVQFLVSNQGDTASFSAGDRIVINPSQFGDLDTSSNASASVESCATDCSESDGVYTINDSFSSHSVANRHYIYNANNSVTYCIGAGVVSREQNGNRVTVGDSIDNSQSTFSYTAASLQRGGLVHMDFTFINDDGETSVYKHDVQVLNVP